MVRSMESPNLSGCLSDKIGLYAFRMVGFKFLETGCISLSLWTEEQTRVRYGTVYFTIERYTYVLPRLKRIYTIHDHY